jgi:hypothetical protein
MGPAELPLLQMTPISTSRGIPPVFGKTPENEVIAAASSSDSALPVVYSLMT